MRKVILTLLYVFAISGCSLNPQPPLAEKGGAGSCIAALTELQQLSLSDVGIQQGELITGAPWLRSNRLVDYFRQQELTAEQLNDLLSNMSQLAATGLKHESRLLPAFRLKQWQHSFDISDPDSFIDDCSQKLVQQQIQTPDQTRQWLHGLPKDDDYQPLARIAGLYPVTSLLFKEGVIREHNWLYQQPENLKNRDWITYGPPTTPDAAPDIHSVPRNSLGIPSLTPALQQALLEYHAPLWQLPDNAPVNRPGKPYWDNDKLRVKQQPVSFTYISHGIYQNRITLQLNYLIWFPERPPASRLDLVAGKHDAVLFRVHLTQTGDILAYDSIHLCGCWYSLILPKDQSYTVNRGVYREPTFVLRTDRGRQSISLTADSHLLIASQRNEQPSSDSQQYRLEPFTDLLQLKTADSRRSVFNRQGFVPGSERPERWLFWPMGISNPGALRRPGDHAIRFVGHLHFDDPLILEKLGVGGE